MGRNRRLVPTFAIYRKDVHKRSELIRNLLAVTRVGGSGLRGQIMCKKAVPNCVDRLSINLRTKSGDIQVPLNQCKCLSLPALNGRGLFKPLQAKPSPFQAPVDIFSVAAQQRPDVDNLAVIRTRLVIFNTGPDHFRIRGPFRLRFSSTPIGKVPGVGQGLFIYLDVLGDGSVPGKVRRHGICAKVME